MATTRLRRYFRHGMFPQLLAFEACVRLGSVTRAAEELCLAQPTVSCLVKKLADAFGGPLTQIRDRRVVATPLGLEVLSLARDLVAVFEAYDRAPQSPPEPPWPSNSPARRPSRSKPRASPFPHAKPRPGETTGGL